MCEPAHSIVQYPDDLPFGGGRGCGMVFGKVMDWCKKVGGFIHFSKLGAGHSESLRISPLHDLYIPEEARFEGLWWDRTFDFDSFNSQRSLERKGAAERYHNDVVFRDMCSFRRFLETSLRQSDKCNLYAERLMEFVLTPKGRDKLYNKLRSLGGGREIWKVFHVLKPQAIKTVMGITRQRGLFLPHFADDSNLWR